MQTKHFVFNLELKKELRNILQTKEGHSELVDAVDHFYQVCHHLDQKAFVKSDLQIVSALREIGQEKEKTLEDCNYTKLRTIDEYINLYREITEPFVSEKLDLVEVGTNVNKHISNCIDIYEEKVSANLNNVKLSINGQTKDASEWLDLFANQVKCNSKEALHNLLVAGEGSSHSVENCQAKSVYQVLDTKQNKALRDVLPVSVKGKLSKGANSACDLMETNQDLAQTFNGIYTILELNTNMKKLHAVEEIAEDINSLSGVNAGKVYLLGIYCGDLRAEQQSKKKRFFFF